MREYRVWCATCAVEFLLPERLAADAPVGVRVRCPGCGDWKRYEPGDIKIAEYGRSPR
jgi:DNA-directed RNA polymerase subunit RPC12/RpoP